MTRIHTYIHSVRKRPKIHIWVNIGKENTYLKIKVI